MNEPITEAVLYARFSPRREAAHCESCITQLEICRDVALARGLEIVGEHHDDALSGKSMKKRAGLRSALEQVCEQRGRVLVVYSHSRLSRNLEDMGWLVRKLAKRRARLLSIKEHIDLSNAIGRFTFLLQVLVNQLEREQTGERTSDAMLRHQKRGRAMSGVPPFGQQEGPVVELVGQDGHIQKRRTYVENPEEQAILTRIREETRKGVGLRALARLLTSDGVLCRGRAWNHVTLRKILSRKA